MQKPASLRTALTAALPELRDQPDRLVIWVEDGAVRARQTETHGFAFQYPLSVLLREMSTDIAIVALAINRWLRRHQPNLLAGGKGDSYSFETDVLDNATADIMFTIALCENVDITPQPDGSWSVDYLAEPDPLFGDMLGFSDPLPDLDGFFLDLQLQPEPDPAFPNLIASNLLGSNVIPPIPDFAVPEADDILSFISILDGALS